MKFLSVKLIKPIIKMKKIRLSILTRVTVIFCILSDSYIAIVKSTTFGVNPDNWRLYHVGFIFAIIILLIWYIYDLKKEE